MESAVSQQSCNSEPHDLIDPTMDSKLKKTRNLINESIEELSKTGPLFAGKVMFSNILVKLTNKELHMAKISCSSPTFLVILHNIFIDMKYLLITQCLTLRQIFNHSYKLTQGYESPKMKFLIKYLVAYTRIETGYSWPEITYC